jgi:excisionase family DNA binding protein
MNSNNMSQILMTNLTPVQLKELVLEALRELNPFQPLKKISSSNDEEKYLTRKEVANYLQISLPTLHEYSKREILKSYRIGSKVRYKASEVAKALKERVYSFQRKGGNHGA